MLLLQQQAVQLGQVLPRQVHQHSPLDARVKPGQGLVALGCLVLPASPPCPPRITSTSRCPSPRGQ